MARNDRGARRDAIGGRRATSSGRKKADRSQAEKYKLHGAAAREAEDVPCPSRSRHDKSCICGGTGTVKGTK
jgi:hypothetical protein